MNQHSFTPIVQTPFIKGAIVVFLLLLVAILALFFVADSPAQNQKGQGVLPGEVYYPRQTTTGIITDIQGATIVLDAIDLRGLSARAADANPAPLPRRRIEVVTGQTTKIYRIKAQDNSQEIEISEDAIEPLALLDLQVGDEVFVYADTDITDLTSFLATEVVLQSAE